MNLGLVVVVAVALTVPNLSEGRTVHQCELKEQLEEALVLPRRLQRHRERILAIVVCEAYRMSRLDTGLVKVFGKRRSTTTKPPTRPTKPVKPTTPVEPSGPTTPVEPTRSTTPVEPTRSTTPVEPSGPTTPVEPTRSTTPVEPSGPTTPVGPSGPTTPVEPTGPTTPVEPTNPAMTTSETNRTTVIARAKRAADSNSDEADSSDSLEEVMTEEERKVREGLENSMMGNDETEEEEGQEEDENEEDTEEEEGQEEDDDEEEGGERKKRGLRGWRRRKKIVSRSIGFYGLFQLSDSYFCNSGYRWSKNKCNTSCTAFTDDNIEDDIECLVKSHYWWTLVKRASRRCRSYHFYNYLRSCN